MSSTSSRSNLNQKSDRNLQLPQTQDQYIPYDQQKPSQALHYGPGTYPSNNNNISMNYNETNAIPNTQGYNHFDNQHINQGIIYVHKIYIFTSISIYISISKTLNMPK